MKAMVLKAPGDARIEEVESPSVPSGHCLVRVTSSGVCGTDRKIFDGAIPSRYPRIMGHEMVGEAVDGFDDGPVRPGERVIVNPALSCGRCFWCEQGQDHLCPQGALLGRDVDGGFAEYVAVPSGQVYALPSAVDDRDAPLLQVLTTCVHAQRLVGVFPGESVLVMGLGVSGLLHLQLAKARGAHPVIAITRSAWKRQLALQLGADVVLPGGPDAKPEDVLEVTQGRGADVVIESTGFIQPLVDGIEAARIGGRMLLFGITTSLDQSVPAYQLYFKELALVSARAARGEDYPTSIDLVARGVVQLAPLVTEVVSLSTLPEALRSMASPAERRLKIIVENAR